MAQPELPRPRTTTRTALHAPVHLARANSATQLVSHVLPPSCEEACSQRGESVSVRVHCERTLIGRPSYSSSPINVPPSSTKRPRTGGPMFAGVRPSSHQLSHSFFSALN